MRPGTARASVDYIVALLPGAPHGGPAEHHAELLIAFPARQRLEHGIADEAPEGHRCRSGLGCRQREAHVLQSQAGLEAGRLEAGICDEAPVALIHRAGKDALADELEELARLDAVARRKRRCLTHGLDRRR